MRPTLEPWWRQDLRTHPRCVQVSASAPRWEPTPVAAPRVEDAAHGFSVRWALGAGRHEDLGVEVVGGHLVLRATCDGRIVSRAVPLPEGVDLGRRRDHWTGDALLVVVPRPPPSRLARWRLWLGDCLRAAAAKVAPE